MERIIRIGDQVRFKGTQFLGEVSGIGHTFILFNASPKHNFPEPSAMSAPCFIVRLKDAFVVTATDCLVRGRGPSAFPGSIFIYEVTATEDQLEYF
jgi:hypothetical protein